MGDLADMMLNGTLCEQCGEPMFDCEFEPDGIPGLCAACEEENEQADLDEGEF